MGDGDDDDRVDGGDDSWCWRLSLYCNLVDNLELLFQYT